MANKRYYWLKLMKDFFQQARIKKLRKIPGGDTYVVIYLKMMLLAINSDGEIVFESIEPTFEEELALTLDEEVDAVKILVAFLKANDLIRQKNESDFYMVEVPSLVGSETAAAERKRRSRAKQKFLKCDNVTQLSHTVTTSHTEKEIEKIEEKKEEHIKYIKDLLNRFFNDPINHEVFAIQFYDYLKPKNKKSTQEKIWYANTIKENLLNGDLQTIENLNRFVEYQEMEKFNQTQGE